MTETLRTFTRKNEAMGWRDYQEKTSGGTWVISGYGRGSYEVKQTLTREQKVRSEGVQRAEMMLSPDFDFFTGSFGGLNRTKAQLEAKLAEWKTRFEKHPFDAFRWADTAVETAAEYNVVCAIVIANERGVNFKDIVEKFELEAGRRCEYQRYSSSSTMSNLSEEYERIQYVKYAKMLRSYYTEVEQARGYLYGVAEGLV